MKTICKRFLLSVALLLLGIQQGIGAYTLPHYHKTQLDNGLTLYLMEQKEVPLIDATVIINAGATEDGAKPGLAAMTSENLLFGAGTLSKSVFEEKLEFVGAQMSTQTTLDYSKVSSSFAAKDQQQILAMLADVILRPQFDQAEFDKYKTRYLGSLIRQKESPRSVLNDYFKQLVFENHPYRAVVGGDADSVKSAQVDDLKGFHQRWFRPQNAALIVVGDFDSKTMSSQLSKLFSKWQGHGTAPNRTSLPKASQAKEARVLLVNKEDARESTFRIGGLGIAKSNPDYVALSVINTILGARFTSWLNDELRVNSGLTYGARSRFDASKASGTFYLSTFTATKNTEAAIDLALKTYARLWEKGIDEATLASAKAYVKGRFPPNYETSAQLASLLGDMFVYGFDQGYIDNFQSNVDKLDIARSKALIAKYFPRDKLQFAIIGKSSDIKDTVKKYGEVTEIDITAPGFKL